MLRVGEIRLQVKLSNRYHPAPTMQIRKMPVKANQLGIHSTQKMPQSMDHGKVG